MPIHDWTRVDAGIFHDFHHEWIATIRRAVKRELAGTDYYAMVEQIAGDTWPDVLTLQRPVRSSKATKKPRAGGLALAEAPPQLRFRISSDALRYAAKQKAVTIRHVSGHRIVAVLEILSPGNKAGQTALKQFVHKAQRLLAAGIHFSVVDLFPPTRRDPRGIHPLIWGNDDATFRFSSSKPLTCASYVGGMASEAFVEPVAAGDNLPTIPMFLTSDEYVPVMLEKTYEAAFEVVPDVWQEVLTASEE